MDKYRDSNGSAGVRPPSFGNGRTPDVWAGSVAALDSASVRNMVYVMGGFAMGVLLDSDGRQELRDKCSERLQEEHGVNVQYAEQAVLANLDWGIDGLEKAIKATNPETRAARLEHTEKMLQVAVLLNPKHGTAGVPNSYLSAWANFYMALVCKLRNNDRNAALHLLDMFLLEPAHARRDFAPTLWDQLFRPHMVNIEAWYQGELGQIMTASPPLSSTGSGGMLPIPKPMKRRTSSIDSGANGSASGSGHSRSLSRSQDFENASNFSDETGDPRGQKNRHLTSLGPDQMMRMELLNKLYQDSLDENTQQYAQYFKDWMAYDADSSLGSGTLQSSPAFPRINPPQSSSLNRAQEKTTVAVGGVQQLRSPPGRSPPRSTFSAVDGASGVAPAVAGGVKVLQKRVALLRQPSMDREHDSFSEGSFKDAPGYSRNSSIKESLNIREVREEPLRGDVMENGYEQTNEEGTGRGGDQNFDSRIVTGEGMTMGEEDEDEEGEDAISCVDFEKGAGVYLDGEELTEDEVLQVWEELSEGRIAVQEANDFISRLTDGEGRALDVKMLSEVAEAVKAYRRDHPEQQKPVDNKGSLETASAGSKYSMSPRSDIEEEETVMRNRQEFDSRTRNSESLSRMDSQSSMSSLSSRNNIFQQKLYSREQSLVRPPKDFVCPITNQLFQDPVTLETGQTYERGAIKEWLDRGNTSCPITRQTLKNLKLPKTNYVLKRLVDNWKDDHPEYFQEFTRGEAMSRTSSGRFGRVDAFELEGLEGSVSPVVYSSSIMSDEIQRPSRRYGQKVVPLPAVSVKEVRPEDLEEMLRQLKSAVDTLFRTEDLEQCEKAVRVAAYVWVESKCDAAVAASLSKAGVVEGFMEVLSSSKKDEILRSIVCLLSDLISKDEFTRHTVMRTDPEIASIITVLRNKRVPQIAVLLHLLKVPATQISSLKLVPLLTAIVKNDQSFDEGTFSMCMTPKAAAVYILEQLVTTLDHRTNMGNAEAIVSAEGVPSLMERLEAKALEEKISAVAVLWSCLQSDGKCRMLMVENLKMSTLVDLLHNSKEQARTVAIFFLAELIRLHRRSVIETLLRDVLNEGFLNSMHVLMLHLQMSPLEHRPLVASLLLQLDLLAEPQKHSVYREEAVDALVEALSCEENTKVQLEAAKALASLSGRYTNTGKPATEAALLKHAGFEDDYKGSGKSDPGRPNSEMDQSREDEEKAAEDWDRRMAMAVLGSGKSLIEALGVALPSKFPKLARPCVVAAAWLTCSLGKMPDATLQSYARNCFLPSLVSILQGGRDVEGRVLACLSLHNLTNDSVGVQQLTIFSKDLLGPLRRLRRLTWTSKLILDALAINPFVDSNVDMWIHGEVGNLNASQSGETRALLYFKGYLYSGHADASIKIWGVKRRMPRLVQEVREHTRAVLCLTVLEDECKLFSGSADKTVRVWLVEEERMTCLQVIDVKEAVHSVAVNSFFICVIPQGVGLKVLDAGGANPRLLNAHKHVQSITFGEDFIYCGCTDSSIQEIDPVNGTSVTIQSGIRSLRGKKAVYSMQLFKSYLYTGGTLVDGIAAKIWKASSRSLVSSISTQIDVRVIAVTDDLLYLASNLPTGVVEVWLREKCQKVATFTVGSKVLALAMVGETLYTASVDGKLRAWGLI